MAPGSPLVHIPLPDLSPLDYAVLLIAGLFAGVINTVAGGGSALTLPALIFIGLPGGMANATNRVGVILQNITALKAFRSGGVREDKLSWRLTVAAFLGSIAGTWIAAKIPDAKFERILGVMLLFPLPLVIWKPKAIAPDEATSRDAWTPLVAWRRSALLGTFVLLGMYAGFVQGGVGILVVAALSWLGQIDLVRGNYIKLQVILATVLISIPTFMLNDVQIMWTAGIVAGIGQMLGALVGSWVAIKKGEVWIRRILVVAILLSSAKLLEFI